MVSHLPPSAPRPGPHAHSRSAVHRKLHNWTFLPFLQFFGGGIYAPDPSTYDPIEILLNAEAVEIGADGETERDRLTARWRDNKLSELNFVGVVSALLAGVLTSTGSWPSILPSGEVSPWPIRTTWYCGIVLSLFSILTAADQTVRLHRLSSHRDGLANLRKLLSKTVRKRKCDEEAEIDGVGAVNAVDAVNGVNHGSERGGQANGISDEDERRRITRGRVQPSLLQVVTWQMPVMFLTSATICMTVGLFLHVWSATPHFGRTGHWDDDSKVAVTYTVVALIAIMLFCVGQYALYSPIRRC